MKEETKDTIYVFLFVGYLAIWCTYFCLVYNYGSWWQNVIPPVIFATVGFLYNYKYGNGLYQWLITISPICALPLAYFAFIFPI